MKRFSIAIAAICFVCSVFALSACEEETAKSRLIGTFTYSETKSSNESVVDDSSLRIYGKEEDAQDGDMYCTVYPFDTVAGNLVSYGVEQRLQLKRDYTYRYQYTITLTNLEQWGKSFASMTVVLGGTFTYEATGPSAYDVRLEDPTSGTQTVYGCTVTMPGNIYAWTLSPNPTYEFDLAAELARNADYAYSRYFKGRTVEVDKEEKAVYDDIYYADVMNDIAPYSDYTF